MKNKDIYLLLYFSAIIANDKVLIRLRKRLAPLLFSVISRIQAHVMLKPKHPGFCLAAHLYL